MKSTLEPVRSQDQSKTSAQRCSTRWCITTAMSMASRTQAEATPITLQNRCREPWTKGIPPREVRLDHNRAKRRAFDLRSGKRPERYSHHPQRVLRSIGFRNRNTQQHPAAPAEDKQQSEIYLPLLREQCSGYQERSHRLLGLQRADDSCILIFNKKLL